MTVKTTEANVNGAGQAGSGEASFPQLVWRLTGIVKDRLSPGEVAALRRLRPEDPGCPAFWRLMATEIMPQDSPMPPELSDEYERRWATVLVALALLGGLVDKNLPLGAALADSGYSEIRFERLLRSGDKGLRHELLLAVRFLAAKAQPVNPVGIARLALTTDPEKGKSLRRQVARDYYRINAKKEKES